MEEVSFSNLAYLEEQYTKYTKNKDDVEASWRHFFEGWEMGQSVAGASLDLQIDRLITAYRTYGHLKAGINCLQENVAAIEELSLQKWGFGEDDLNKFFPTCGFLPQPQAPLRDLVAALEKTYCGAVGIEFMGLRAPDLEAWLEKRIEPGFPIPFNAAQKLEIFQDLNRAELFEHFLHTKYVGQKRFSLEGAETLIPMLAFILDEAGGDGVQDVVVGMSHRGRLNVLANILNKSYGTIFYEFEAHFTPDLSEGTGDVKYHKGLVGTVKTKEGHPLRVTLAANPSHLESVDPVVEGQARAMQQLHGKGAVLPILIHGDASVAGQGVVYETMQLSKLKGYATGGTVHIVINNQIGFTTLPQDGRSSRYCTDIAYAFGAPVFHVNAENPEECVLAAQLALQIRQKFHCDVFLDLNCYRKWGHNEGDEPAFTQPYEYQLIRAKKSIRQIYLDKLVNEGILTSSSAEEVEKEFRATLQRSLEETAVVPKEASKPPISEPIETSVEGSLLKELAADFCSIPQSFKIHPKIGRLLQERQAMLEGKGIDWGMAEHLAYATLLAEGVHVRISGQDSRRGTFSHRHAVWVDQEQEEKRYYPLSHLKKAKAPFDIYNSPLSEFAVLGFDFGYSLFYQNSLVIWEAQYGDFANGAQVIIDQYICCSEQKWGHRSGITLFLPHGFEGQGPEHSSARLERYLQLSSDNNWQIVNCSTPAQLFHLLRRQGKRKDRKPLILLTPKALLRHPQFISPLEEFTTGSFQPFFADPTIQNPRRVLVCSGKVYYDLLAARKKTDIAIVRIDELYPFEAETFKLMAKKYPSEAAWFWVQEEHSNMGAATYIRPLLEEVLGKEVGYCGRGPSAATAAGSYALHKQQLKWMEEALEN
jgi:2-oxoglutarate dehydrogenase E1 component